jgi:EF hand
MRQETRLWSAVVTVAAGLALSSPAWAHCDGSPEDFKAAKAEAFAAADADGDGKLNPTEFANMHAILRQKLEALRFTKLDTDGDGFVTQAELEAGRGGCGRREGGPF